MRLYIWNARLCEALYLPTQFAEVAVRNAIHKPVRRRFGDDWHDKIAFQAILPVRLTSELNAVVDNERRFRGARFTENHVVAGLSFGFWTHLLTASYTNHLWANGLRQSFPNLPREMDREDLYRNIDQLRRFRNKLAHHYAIFDRSPRAELHNALAAIGWACQDTKWLAEETNHFERVLGRKPRP